MTEITVLHYLTASGASPYQEWFESVRDRTARAAVLARINRVRAGTLGDWKIVGDSVFELRIDHGSGYRIYFGRDGNTVVVLLAAGAKKSQHRDIKNAKENWRDYEARTKGTPSRRPA
jgi:putative addiction module killer protein